MTSSEYQQLTEFLSQQFAGISQQFAGIDQQCAGIGRQFAEIDRRFVEMDRRLVELDRRFTARFDAIDEQFREVFGRFDEIYRRLERLEQEYHAIVEGLRRIEGLLVEERVQRELLVRRLEEVKRQVATLQARIEELEQRIRE
jgi:DNA repair exonuclease SbcCD ATPase subunit